MRLDPVLPPEIARRAEETGVKKAGLAALPTFLLALLAGAFIAMGAIFFVVAITGSGPLGFGPARVLGGVVFSTGLILVIGAGAELFTGNNLVVMAWASRRIASAALLRNWVIVYAGNFIGSILTAILLVVCKTHELGGGAVGETVLGIGAAKCSLGFAQAMGLGIICNALVCLAVWLSLAGQSLVDKVIAIVFPIAAFVACGFEHCVANMFLIPWAILIQPEAVVGTEAEITWAAAAGNIVPVTIGNIIGGAFLVAGIYWVVFCRGNRDDEPK